MQIVGRWKCPEFASEWSFVGTIDVNSDNDADGSIDWTMNSAGTDESLKGMKVGQSAREFVRGQFNRKTRILALEGYRMDPADAIAVTGHYQFKFDNQMRNFEVRALPGGEFNEGNGTSLVAESERSA